MLFWSTIAVITLLVLWAVLWPLVRSRSDSAGDDRDPLVAVYRDRQREIESERASGRLSEAEADAALDELVAQMARELPERPVDGPGPMPRSPVAARLIAALLVVLVPGLSGLIYLQLGAPELTDPDTLAALSAPPRFEPAQVEQLIGQVEERVRSNPNDGEAWLVLASARKFQGHHAGAVEAFERALRLNPPGARMLAEFAESLALLAQGSFAGRPLQLLEQALGVDPDDSKAVALMGAAQFQIGNYGAARALLGRLFEALPSDQTDQRAAMAEVIKRIDDRIAAEGGTSASGGTAPRPTGPSGASTPPSANATGIQGADAPGVEGSVRLDAALTEQAAGAGTLFITARAVTGPRIPYAALRIDQPRWPLEFRLDDRLAMDPSRRLSSASEVVIEARLSRSGTATRQAGDLYGTAGPVAPGATGLRIVIDRIVTP